MVRRGNAGDYVYEPQGPRHRFAKPRERERPLRRWRGGAETSDTLRRQNNLLIAGILLFGLFTNTVQGQSPIDSSRFSVHAYPLELVDAISRQMLTIGVEYKVTPRWAVVFGGGIKIREDYLSDTTWIRSEGYALRAEAKRYFHMLLGRPGFYAAAEYRWVRSNGTTDLYYADTTLASDEELVTSFVVDAFGYLQDIQIANLKFGKVITKKHFMMDVYAGIGIRWRSVTNTHLEFGNSPHHVLDQPRDPNLNYEDIKRSLGQFHTGAMINGSLGLRIGWRF